MEQRALSRACRSADYSVRKGSGGDARPAPERTGPMAVTIGMISGLPRSLSRKLHCTIDLAWSFSEWSSSTLYTLKEVASALSELIILFLKGWWQVTGCVGLIGRHHVL